MKSIRVAVAAAAVGLALTACSSPVEAGAAAVVGKERISANELSTNVKEYEAALAKAKVTPQQLGFPGSISQIVLFQLAQISQYEQLVASAGVQVSEGEIDQFIAASTQDPQKGTLEQQMLGSGIAPSKARDYMRISVGLQKLLQQYGGGNDEAAQQRGNQKLAEAAQAIPITYSPRYGAINQQRSEQSPQLFVDPGRFGKVPAPEAAQPQG